LRIGRALLLAAFVDQHDDGIGAFRLEPGHLRIDRRGFVLEGEPGDAGGADQRGRGPRRQPDHPHGDLAGPAAEGLEAGGGEQGVAILSTVLAAR
jgi:hypothetical protein